MTSISPSLTGVPPRVVQKTRWASGSCTFRCRCPMETPAALGAGNWPHAVETRQRRKIAEVRVRISIESLVCHLFGAGGAGGLARPRVLYNLWELFLKKFPSRLVRQKFLNTLLLTAWQRLYQPR